MISILVTGAKGQLGSEISRISSSFTDMQFFFIDKEELDLTNFDAVSKFFQQHPVQLILNCAAYTAVDQAESEPDVASKLNAEVPGFLASLTRVHGSLLVHLSTDYVFDGKDYMPYKETDIPNPQSIYGKTKLDGENAILFNCDRSVIIRTSWLYSAFGNNFVKTILRKSTENKHLQVVCDQVGNPTYAGDLAKTLLTLVPLFLQSNQHQVYHYANEGITSWYDFAIAITELAGIDCDIEAVETNQYPFIATRPPYSVLNKNKIKSLGIIIPYWRHSLAVCLKEILQNKS